MWLPTLGVAAIALAAGSAVGWWFARGRGGARAATGLRLWTAASEPERPEARHAEGEPHPPSAFELGLDAATNRLNNRLAAIIGYLELAERAQALDPTVLDRVRAETREAADIVRDLTRLGRKSDRRLATHLETALVGLIEQRRDELATRGIDVSVDVSPAVSLVSGRQADVVSLFSWLLAFAEARLRDVPPPRRVRWAGRVLGAGVVVTQVDNGPPLPPGHIPQKLDYFRPVERNFLGHGELAFAQRVAENCGAGLRIEATPDGPGEVTVTLIPASLLEAPLRQPRRMAPRSGTSLQILVVDDDAGNRDAMQRLLTLEGHQVSVAADGLEALERLAQGHFDVVVADLNMPRLGGSGLYEQVREARPELARRFVFITGDDARAVSREFLSRVRQPTLTKPYSVTDLVAAVNEIAAQ